MLDIVKACRFDYELLGEDLEALSRRYDIPIDALENTKKIQQWARRVECTALTATTTDIDTFARKLEETTRSKLSVVALVRQIENQALYAQLEHAFVNKAFAIVDAIDENSEKASSQLLAVIQAVDKLQSRNPLMLADQLSVALKDRSGSSKDAPTFNVLIQNQV